MKSNFNVDVKFYADRVLDVLSNSLSKYKDKIAGSKSDGTGSGRGQGRGGGRDGYGLGARCRGSRGRGRR